MVILGTSILSPSSLFVMPFPSKFSYSAYVRQTFSFWQHWEQKTDFFFIYGRNFCFDSINEANKFEYRIFSNKRPLSFKRLSPINAQYNPKNIL